MGRHTYSKQYDKHTMNMYNTLFYFGVVNFTFIQFHDEYIFCSRNMFNMIIARKYG